ncbi:MAG: DUF4905 domain-containing protein [Thermonemataceae bacterium]|nr:DUF4905 domain-containing protein [Thermonemataceae bacterium]
MQKYQTKANIWKILVDEINDYLLLEIRDAEKQEVSFDILSLGSQGYIAQNLNFWEKWWISARAIIGGKILLAFLQGDSPLSKGVMLYDLHKKDFIWQNMSMYFHSFDEANNCVYLSQYTEMTHLRAYDLDTGQAIEREYTLLKKNTENTYVYPTIYTEKNPYFADLQNFVNIKTNHIATKEFFYIEHAKAIVLLYETEIKEKFVYFLLITDIAGNIRVHESLEQDKKLGNEDIFFIVKDYLILLPHTKQIWIYHLA